jgi:molecular chaperone DnaK
MTTSGRSASAGPVWFGIDLGTTLSSVAYLDTSGRPVVARNAVGEEKTPSVVYFERPNEVVVGAAAKNCALVAPGLTAQLVKRDMGKPDVVAEYHGKKYTPEQISALVLRELTAATHATTGMTVEDVVITVPAYFGIAEREATRRAGELAGLTVRDLIDEPVAAAMYHKSLRTSGVTHLLVCDLGGGTCDTALIAVDGEHCKTVCTFGERELGGADWDERIRRHLVDRFREQYPELDPTADDVFQQTAMTQAEQLKKDLSSLDSRRVDLRFRGRIARVELTRSELEELTADLLDRVVDVVRRTVELAGRAGVHEFDDVILVGGMSHMPAVARLLSERLGLAAYVHEPDLAVARGAALYARLAQVKAHVHGETPADAAAAADHLGLTVEEVNTMAARNVTGTLPRAFGVLSVDPSDPLAFQNPMKARKIVVHLLRANEPLPADSGVFPFTTVIDNQRMAEIEVWEARDQEPSEEVRDNTKVGRGRLLGLPEGEKGRQFDIRFQVSATGTLSVHAADRESGAETRFELQIGGLSTTDLRAARADIARHRVSG